MRHSILYNGGGVWESYYQCSCGAKWRVNTEYTGEIVCPKQEKEDTPVSNQSLEEFIADSAFYAESGGVGVPSVATEDLRAWMSGHVRVPVEVLEAAASALIPLSNAAMPIEREGLTDEHNEAAYSALGKLAPYLSGSKDWSWLTASKGE